MSAEPLLLGQERADAIHRQTRGFWSVVMLVSSALFLALAPLVPGAASLLRVGLKDTIPVAVLFAGASVSAAVVYHRRGWSRTYFIWNDIETAVSVGVCLYLVYASGSALSIFWLFLLLTAFFAASTSTFWSRPRELLMFAAPLTVLVLAFALKGAFADAVLALVFSVTSAWMVGVLSSTSRQLQASLDRQAELQRRNQELLIKQERSRIARDLHDGLGTDMAGLVWQVRALQVQAQGTEWEDRLRPLSARLSSGVDELRGVVWAMRAESRPWPKLVSELSERCAGASQHASFTVERSGGNADLVIPGALAGAAVRMALESVRNADRHADARAIALRLAVLGETLRIEVSDDGRGVPEAELTYSQGGLRNLRDRASELGGTLEVSPGHPGTRVVFTAPLSSVAPEPASDA